MNDRSSELIDRAAAYGDGEDRVELPRSASEPRMLDDQAQRRRPDPQALVPKRVGAPQSHGQPDADNQRQGYPDAEETEAPARRETAPNQQHQREQKRIDDDTG